jgi:hypothetical protein
LVRNVHRADAARLGVQNERPEPEPESDQMIDAVLMLVGIGFFLLCWGYAVACARM